MIKQQTNKQTPLINRLRHQQTNNNENKHGELNMPNNDGWMNRHTQTDRGTDRGTGRQTDRHMDRYTCRR